MNNSIIDVGRGVDIVGQVMSKFSISLLIMTIGMIVGAMFVPPAVAIMMPIVCVVMLLVAMFARWRQRESEGSYISMKFVYVFAALEGVGLYPIVMAYTQAIGAKLVLGAVAITFVLFFGLATYAKRTERNFLNIGSILFGALLILILASIVGIFVQATILQTAICAGGIFVFSGYVLYDIQVMKSGYLTEDDVPRKVLNLFLDWINLFLYILRLIGLFAADN